jgi:hypothetical protein
MFRFACKTSLGTSQKYGINPPHVLGIFGNKHYSIYSYNKTNEIHKFIKFIFGIELYIFRRGCSILLLLADSRHNLYDIYLLLCIQY